MKGGSILITGGTGSFGQAFVRELIESYQRICVYSRGEHAQAAMRDHLRDHPSLRWFIGDIRDRDRLRRAMDGCEHVVHAAALKRIEVGAYNPEEMVKTNVLGAVNVLEAARDAGVRRLVMLSTDKAWQPISPYGYSKALAESIILAGNDEGRGLITAAVRYGNVWCSNGSVVPRWKMLIGQGKPLPITDPNCTRFFMRLEQAVEMVRDSLTIPHGGKTIIPAGLPAYRLGDLQLAFHEVYGPQRWADAPLPSHEKMHEGMDDNLTSDKAPRMTTASLRGEIERG